MFSYLAGVAIFQVPSCHVWLRFITLLSSQKVVMKVVVKNYTFPLRFMNQEKKIKTPIGSGSECRGSCGSCCG